MFDEATSALDATTEAALMGCINEFLHTPPAPTSAYNTHMSSLSCVSSSVPSTQESTTSLPTLSSHSSNRTGVFIAHRLSTIMHCDVIIVLDKGNVAEVGSHEDLVAQNDGIYHKMWSSQQYEEEEVE